MQGLASWLVARPQNAILALAFTLVLPLAPVLSGACLAMLVLLKGPVRAALEAAIALAILSVLALLIDGSATVHVASAVIVWVPVALLAALLRQMRSLTLTLQIVALFAASAVVAIFVILGDPVAFWKQLLTDAAPLLAEMGWQQQAEAFLTLQDEIAPQLTIIVVFTGWSVYVAALLLGYALWLSLPGKQEGFGRFRDLNFGRVLAIMMAVAWFAGWAGNIEMIQNIAVVLFMVFWYQGLAIVHWLRVAKRLPTAILVMVYVSLFIPVVQALPLTGLAIAGYADAWFDFRSRATAQNVSGRD